jgi:hypothetical protein
VARGHLSLLCLTLRERGPRIVTEGGELAAKLDDEEVVAREELRPAGELPQHPLAILGPVVRQLQ